MIARSIKGGLRKSRTIFSHVREGAKLGLHLHEEQGRETLMRRQGPPAHVLIALVVLSLVPSYGQDDDPPRSNEETKVLNDLVDGKSVDLFTFQGGGVENVCLSGGYVDPVLDIRLTLKKDFASCSGWFRSPRGEDGGAISFVWPDRCHVIDVNRSEFLVETQNGSSCYDKTQAKAFKLEETPYGLGLIPKN